MNALLLARDTDETNSIYTAPIPPSLNTTPTTPIHFFNWHPHSSGPTRLSIEYI